MDICTAAADFQHNVKNPRGGEHRGVYAPLEKGNNSMP